MYQPSNSGVQNNNPGEYESELVNELDLPLDKTAMDCRALYLDPNTTLSVYATCYIKGGVYHYLVNTWTGLDRLLQHVWPVFFFSDSIVHESVFCILYCIQSTVVLV